MNDNNVKKEVLNLDSMLGYQEGSIVSRALINKDVGTLTLFSFDKGESLSEHTAPFDALVYLIDGEAEIIIAGKPLHAKQGDMVIMPAHQPHALRAIKKFKMILTMIRS